VKTNQPTGEPETDFACHLAGSLKIRWKRYRKALKRCQRNFSEGSVHDSRIETRRLLSTFDLLESFLPASHLRKARRLLKRHLEAFSELRDTQVQRLHVAKLRPRFPDLAVFEKALRKRERRCIREARPRIKRLGLARLERQIKQLRSELKQQRSQSLRNRSVKAVSAAFAEVGKRRRRITPEDTLTIHRTRVAFKHFRYMVEGLEGALAGVTPQRLRALQAYQATMGEIQDTEVLLSSLRKFVRAKRIEPGVATRWFAELERQRQRLIARYLTRADQLQDFWPLVGSASKPASQTRGEQL
jgi:CHAD domain-containing protein